MKLKKYEKGFTIIELLVTISVAVAITGAAAMTIQTLMKVSPQTNNWAIALRQVQNAGYWISRDVQMSSGNITVGNKQPDFLTLEVPYEAAADNITTKTIAYKFETLSGEEWLTRTDSTSGKIVIAEYISADNDKTYAQYSDNCTDNCTLSFTITAISGDVPVTKTYEAGQRVPAQ